MPTYKVTAPNGVTYTVDGPPNASQENLAYAVYLQHPESATPAKEPGFLDYAEGVAKGLGTSLGRAISGLGSEFVTEAPKMGRNLLEGILASRAGMPELSETPAETKQRKAEEARSDAAWAQDVAPVTGALQRTGRRIEEAVGPRTIPSFAESKGFFGGLGSLAVTAAESAVPTLAALATTAATKNPELGLAVMGTLSVPQTYSGIRQQQKKEGIDDVGRAMVGTAASSAFDLLTGTGGAISKIGKEVTKDVLEQGLKQAVKEAVKTGRDEAGTEVLQNFIEQVAGGADPTTKENLMQTLEAGLVGALMGTSVGLASEKINAARVQAAREATPLHTVDVMRRLPSGDEITQQLAILSAPDKRGAVVVRNPVGNIQTVAVKDLEEMRAPPAEGTEHEPLKDIIEAKVAERKEAYDFAQAAQTAIKNPEDTDALNTIAARYAKLYGVPQDKALEYAKASVAQARGEAPAAPQAEGEIPMGAREFAPPEAYADEIGQAPPVAPPSVPEAAPVAPPPTVEAAPVAPPAPIQITPVHAAAILDDTTGEAIREYADSEGIDMDEAVDRLSSIANTGMRYMRGRPPKDLRAQVEAAGQESLFGAMPTQEAGRLAKAEELQQRKLEFTPEARVAQQEQVGSAAEQRIAEVAQRNQEIEKQRLDKAQNDIWAANSKNKPYEVRRVPDSPTPYQVVGPEEADGSREVFVAAKSLTDFEDAVGDLPPYTPRPLSAQAVEGGREIPDTPYTQINRDLVQEITAAREAGRITPNEQSLLVQQIADTGNRKSIEAGEAAYRQAMGELRNADNDAAKRAAEIKIDGIAQDLRTVVNNIVANPVRARLKSLVEGRTDEQVGARMRAENAQVQEALGRMEGANVAPELTEQREAAIDVAEATPSKYMRPEEAVAEPPKVVSREAAQNVINEITSGWRSTVPVEVVNSAADLPEDVRQAIDADQAHGALGFVAPNGTTYILADNLASEADARAALFHEALGHLGLEKLFRNTLDNALMGMYNNNAKLRADVDAWREVNPDAYKRDKNPLARAVEEVLAERSEAGRLETSFFQKIATIIRNFARRMGFKVALTDGDVAAILSMAHDQVVRGKKESAVVKGLRYMTAWHGSPHNFEKFSTGAIGTGEGAQIFGWGLYFTDTKQIAEKQYRDRLAGSKVMVDGTPLETWYHSTQPIDPTDNDYFDVYYELVDIFENKSIGAEEALRLIREYNDTLKNNLARVDKEFDAAVEDNDYGAFDKLANAYNDFAELLKLNANVLKALEALQGSNVRTESAGKLYNVELAPKEDEFLLWDKPVSQQSDKVKAALEALGMNIAGSVELDNLRAKKAELYDTYHELMEDARAEYRRRAQLALEGKAREASVAREQAILDKVKVIAKQQKDINARVAELEKTTPSTGADAYHALDNKFGSPKAASLALLDAGIKGNKYLDGNSRGAGVENPAYNYVLFDDADVSIINKYMMPKKPKGQQEAEEKINRGAQKAQLSADASGMLSGLTEASQGHIEAAKEAFRNRKEALETIVQPANLAISRTDTIRDMIEKADPYVGAVVKNLDKIEQNMRAMGATMEKALTRRIKTFEKFVSKYGQNAISGMMTTARVNRVDVTSADSLAELLKNDKVAQFYRSKATDPSLKPTTRAAFKGHLVTREGDIRAAWKAWEALGKQEGGHELYKQLRQFYKDMYTAIRAEQDEDIRNMGLSKQAEERLIKLAHGEEDIDEDGDVLTDETDRSPGVPQKYFPEEYFPFRRFGDYALIVTPPSGERERYHFESALERNQWESKRAKQLGMKRGDEGYGEVFKQLDGIEDLKNSISSDSAMLGKMFKIIEESSLMQGFDTSKFATQAEANAAAKAELKDKLYQTYLMTLPERSLRKQFIHAEKVTGNSADALRIFKNAASQYKSQLPKLAYGREIQRLIENAYETIGANDPHKDAMLRTLVNAYVGRFRETMNPTNGPGKWEQRISSFTFLQLMTSVYSAALQPIAVPMQVMPRMFARYGPMQTLKVFDSYLPIWEVASMVVDVDPATGEKSFSSPSLGNTDMIQKSPLRSRLWEELNDKRDLFSQKHTNLMMRDRRSKVYGTSGVLNRAGNTYEQVVDLSGALISSADQLAREVSGMTFAELHYNKLRKEGASHEEAIEGAVEAAIRNTDETLGNYTNLNKPDIFRGNWAKRAFGYLRTYSSERTSYYLRQWNAITKGSPYQTRWQAFSELTSVLLLSALGAGAKGVFGYTVLCTLIDLYLKATLSDEEKEKRHRENPLGAESADYRFRNQWIPYHLGSDSMAARVLRHGYAAELTGADLGPRLSQNDLWIREGKDAKTTTGIVANFIAANYSPQLSQAMRLGDALDAFKDGDISRGFSYAMPAAVRGFFTAERLGREGEVQPQTGRVVMGAQEFTPADIRNQQLGATPLKLAEAREVNRNIIQWQKGMESERNDLLQEVRKTLREPHTDQDLRDIADKIQAYNRKVPYGDLTYVIQPQDIRQSITTAAKKAAKSVRGVEMTPQERMYLGQ